LKPSDSEDETARARERLASKRTESKSAARVKRGVVISDDEDEGVSKPPPPARPKAAYKAKAKAATPDSGADTELRAMMDIDDGKKKVACVKSSDQGELTSYSVSSFYPLRSSHEGLSQRLALGASDITSRHRRRDGRSRARTRTRTRTGAETEAHAQDPAAQAEERGARRPQRTQEEAGGQVSHDHGRQGLLWCVLRHHHNFLSLPVQCIFESLTETDLGIHACSDRGLFIV
jgi:hypothetical protein